MTTAAGFIWNDEAETMGRDALRTLQGERLRALAHPARLVILRTLAARGSCVCGEVVEVMPLAQATVSQHLKILKEAGLIQGRIEGRSSCYCLDPAVLDALRFELDQLLGKLLDGAPLALENEGLTG